MQTFYNNKNIEVFSPPFSANWLCICVNDFFFHSSNFYLNFIKVCEICDKQFQCSLFVALAEGVSSYLENLQTCKQFADLFVFICGFFFPNHTTLEKFTQIICPRRLSSFASFLSLSSLCLFVSLPIDETCFLKISAHQLDFMLLSMLIEAYCRLTHLKAKKKFAVFKSEINNLYSLFS